MSMKIENYETYKAGVSADTFTFPHNSKIFDDQIDKFIDQKDYAYSFSYFGVTNPLKNRRMISISGFFNGSSKLTSMASLLEHARDNKVKKLFFTSDKFLIGFPTQPKRTHSAGRTNFVDYAMGFISPFGILFGSTQKSGASSSSEENEGDAATPIEQITGGVTEEQVVTVKDGNGNGFTFTASASGTLTVYLIYLVDLGADNFFTEYYYATVGSTKQNLAVADNSKSMFMTLAAGETLNTLFTSGTITNITPTLKFRDGWNCD